MYSWVFDCITFHLSCALLGQSGIIIQNGAITLGEAQCVFECNTYITDNINHLPYTSQLVFVKLWYLGASIGINMFQEIQRTVAINQISKIR